MQEAVSKHYRLDAAPYSKFGEGELLQKLRTHMESKGVDDELVQQQISNLTLNDNPISVPAVMLEPIPDPAVAELSEEEEVQVPMISKHTGDMMGLYVVGVSGIHRRLHRAGLCHRVPVVHYRDFEILGYEMPSSGFTAMCGHCWHKVSRVQAIPSSSSSSSLPSSSSSTFAEAADE